MNEVECYSRDEASRLVDEFIKGDVLVAAFWQTQLNRAFNRGRQAGRAEQEEQVALSQGFEVRKRDTGSKAWESLASSMRPYTELVFVTLLAVEAGELSEGRAVEMLKVNHVELREIRHGLITSLVEFAGQCKSPLTSLLGTITGRQDSSETSTEGRPSSNSSGTEG